MEFTFEVSEQKTQPVLSIRTRTKVEVISDLIGASYMKIIDYMDELGIEPEGAPFTAYYNMDMQDLDVEMGFPVAGPMPDKGEIQSREIPAGKVVSIMYKGPYSGMEKPYNAMSKWIVENGYEPVGTAYEYYFNSPNEVPESELVTEIVMPLK